MAIRDAFEEKMNGQGEADWQCHYVFQQLCGNQYQLENQSTCDLD